MLKSVTALMQWNSGLILRGIYACGFEKPSAIQQRGVIPFCKGLDLIQQAQSGTCRTATFCSGVLQQLDYSVVQRQAPVLAPTRELTQQIEKVMRALGDYIVVNKCARGSTYPPFWCPCCCWHTWSCFDMLRVDSHFQLLPSKFQVGVFSATMPPEALEITRKLMYKTVRILVKRDELTLD